MKTLTENLIEFSFSGPPFTRGLGGSSLVNNPKFNALTSGERQTVDGG